MTSMEGGNFIIPHKENKDGHEVVEGNESAEAILLFEKTRVLKEKIASIDETQLNPEQKSLLESIKEKVLNVSRKFLNTVKWATLVVGTIGVVNYERVHTDLDITTRPDGTHEYHHKDARTEHLLKVLTGREKMTEEDLRIDFNNIIKEQAKQIGVTLPKDPEQMTLDELDEAAFELLSKMGESKINKGDFKKSFLEELAKYNTPDTNMWKPSEQMYELVWRLEQEAGNPTIRFNSEDLHFLPFSDPNGRLHYSPVSNTVFIGSDDFSAHNSYAGSSNLIAELSHGKQYAEHPLSTTIQYVEDVAGVFKHGGFNMQKLTDEYSKLYKTPGSVEHEAHEVIEPYLLKKYKLFIKK